MKFNKWLLIPAATGALVVGGVALADDRDDLADYIPVNQQPANAEYITQEEALKIANERVEGEVVEISLDSDDRRVHFDVEMKDGTYEYEFDIDAVSGDVFDFERDRDDDDSNRSQTQSTSVQSGGTAQVANTEDALTMEEAIAIALNEVTGTVTGAERDDNYYEIEVRDGNVEYEFDIDAFTGEILKFEKDTEDDDDLDD
ncbi:PepSY domain-containing protein [Chryseomicrobium aureum]|uniref:PepSY domain-containing protein n=1 Tax=Chryseomicrobium aureum TaxID=1441723 RepID=UPI00195729C4|nr:PepSY domain-containing protein [Chryseomicrobium aureum]MBM7707250.1 putative membrane protein YkoI [Chryseomicrobium aureum]